MEEKLNQVTTSMNPESQDALGLLAILIIIPLAYYVICCIAGKSSDKRAYFYSYLDVFALFLPVIVLGILILISLLTGNADGKSNQLPEVVVNWILGISSGVAAIITWIFTWRANQGNFLMTLFMFIGKLMFIAIFWIIVIVSILLSAYAIAFANKMQRRKYQKRSSLRKEKVKVGSAAAVGGGLAICGLMRWAVKYHDFSVPPKVVKQVVTTEDSE